MARAKDVAKLLRGGVNDKTSPARLAEIMKALRHAEIAKGITPEKLVSLLEELGPTFIKLGQILSARSDMLPQEYCNALQTLRSSTTPEPSFAMDRCIFSGSPRLRGDTGIRACWHESFEPRCGHPPIEGGFILRLGAGFSFLFLAKIAIDFSTTYRTSVRRRQLCVFLPNIC